MSGQFGRAREVMQAVKRDRDALEKANAVVLPREAVCILAVNRQTQARRIVGVALTDAGAKVLVDLSNVNTSEELIEVIDTTLLQL